MAAYKKKTKIKWGECIRNIEKKMKEHLGVV